ncbi:hypothetical protein [Paenibacillus sonchi]|uniref:hypothetical protein n=1 Tax=Paenibacillus sonchi TaxID=373687 RepID=UPI001E5BFC23|nr:hypothetical protein [Paenibacillus sonchi]MCE3199631.1 hypothetical protein [Paenibacillus sonchi]
MQTDRFIITWFEKQFDDDKDLKNITFEVCNYINNKRYDIEKKEKLHNLLKAIRQDMCKIHQTVNRMQFLHLQDQEKDRALDELYSDSMGSSRVTSFLGTDIEYFFIKYRSIIDYSLDVLIEFFPELNSKKHNLENKMNYLHDVFKKDEQINKMILSSKWFDQLRKIRNYIVHKGASCLVFPNRDCKEILFQIYDTELAELLEDGEFYRYNNNVYYFNRVYVIYMAYLFFYLDTLFKAIIAKEENLDIGQLEKGVFINYPTHFFNLKASHMPNSDTKILLDWITDFLIAGRRSG